MGNNNLETGVIKSPRDLGALARNHRKARGLRQVQLASLSNVSTGFLIDFEKGKPTAQIGKILQVLATLGLEVTLSPRSSRVCLPRHDQK